MKKPPITPLIAFAAIGLMLATHSAASFAQGAPQTINRVDVRQVASGFRASKIVGATVVNDHGDTIGKVDDIIIGNNTVAAYGVLSVGGFIGMGSHLVAVPFRNLFIEKDRITLPGATKDELKALPEFKYATE